VCGCSGGPSCLPLPSCFAVRCRFLRSPLAGPDRGSALWDPVPRVATYTAERAVLAVIHAQGPPAPPVGFHGQKAPGGAWPGGSRRGCLLPGRRALEWGAAGWAGPLLCLCRLALLLGSRGSAAVRAGPLLRGAVSSCLTVPVHLCRLALLPGVERASWSATRFWELSGGLGCCVGETGGVRWWERISVGISVVRERSSQCCGRSAGPRDRSGEAGPVWTVRWGGCPDRVGSGCWVWRKC